MGRIAGVTPQETRERLLDAAARVFELKGYEGATVSLIAREAGLTTGAIYAHYSGKAELLAAALQAHRDRALASLFPPGRRTDAPTALIALGTRLGNRDRASSDLLVEAVLAARRDVELAEVLAAALGDRESTMADLLAGAQEAGDLDGDVSARSAARFALMLGLGSMLVASLDLPATDQDDWQTLMQRLVGAFTRETPV